MYSNKLRPTKILKITKSQKAFNKVEIRHKNCDHQKIKYYNLLEKFSQMHVPDMARPRDAHASKNKCFQALYYGC